MDSPTYLVLYAQAGENNGANQFVLNASSSWFIRAVVQACWSLQQFFCRDSDCYIRPALYMREAWEEEDARFMANNSITGRTQGVSSIIYSGLDLVLEYVKWRNTMQADFYSVGEEANTKQIVYNTLCWIHKHNVKCIELEHAQNGRIFGSATRFQRESVAKDVFDWPQKYKYVEEIRGLDKLMPCERPNYLKDDPFVKGQNMTEIKVENEEEHDDGYFVSVYDDPILDNLTKEP